MPNLFIFNFFYREHFVASFAQSTLIVATMCLDCMTNMSEHEGNTMRGKRITYPRHLCTTRPNRASILYQQLELKYV